MAALRELQNIEKISQLHLLQVRYVLSRFWELKGQERVVIENIVDTGIVEGLSRDLTNMYNRLRETRVKWEHLQ